MNTNTEKKNWPISFNQQLYSVDVLQLNVTVYREEVVRTEHLTLSTAVLDVKHSMIMRCVKYVR